MVSAQAIVKAIPQLPGAQRSSRELVKPSVEEAYSRNLVRQLCLRCTAHRKQNAFKLGEQSASTGMPSGLEGQS